MQFHQMVYMAEAARAGSINKAAARLFVSQSSVSAAILELEEELGVTIFTRTNHGVALTDEGKELLGYLTPIIESKQRVEAFYRKKLAPPPSHFSVSTQRYPFSVAAFIAFIRRKGVDQYVYRIRETDMYLAIEEVYNRRADLGMIFLSGGTENFVGKLLAARRLDFKPIKNVEARVFLGKHHPLAQKEEIALDELTDYPFMAYDADSSAAVSFSEEVELLEFSSVRKTIFISDRATAYNLIANTDAFSFGSGILPPDYVDERITARPIAGVHEHMTLGYIRHRDTPESEDAKLYLQCVHEALGKLAL